MNNKYIFTFIIGYRHKSDRFINLRRTLSWVNSFSNVEVILVEQDRHSKISHLNLGVKHIFIKSGRAYNRSWAFNVGLKYSTTNIIVFSDSDLIMHPDDFINAIKATNEFEMVSPYHSVVDLTPEESGMQIQEIVKINRPGRGETDNQKINICGGISIFRKDAIERIAGWNEDFWSWGGEDDFQTIKVKNFLNWKEMTARCYHLWHQREQPDMTHYQRTLKILEAAQKMSKGDLEKLINGSHKKIGMRNAYDS